MPAWVVIVAGLATFAVLLFPLVTWMLRVDRSDSVATKVMKRLFDFFV